MLHAVFDCPDLDATAALAAAIARIIRSGDILALHGDLGSGKTTFTRALASALGVDARLVSSPTFVIINQYPSTIPTDGDPTPGELVHVDAYRLTSAEDLEPLGWDRFIPPNAQNTQAARNIILLVEWPERIAGALPPSDALASLTFTATGDSSRQIALALPLAWQARPSALPLLKHNLRRCPITNRWVPPNQPTWPFINEQAQMADLNRWFTGNYTISREITPDDVEET